MFVHNYSQIYLCASMNADIYWLLDTYKVKYGEIQLFLINIVIFNLHMMPCDIFVWILCTNPNLSSEFSKIHFSWSVICCVPLRMDFVCEGSRVRHH